MNDYSMWNLVNSRFQIKTPKYFMCHVSIIGLCISMFYLLFLISMFHFFSCVCTCLFSSLKPIKIDWTGKFKHRHRRDQSIGNWARGLYKHVHLITLNKCLKVFLFCNKRNEMHEYALMYIKIIVTNGNEAIFNFLLHFLL